MPSEMNVKRVSPLRFAAERGQERYEAFFEKMNDDIAKQVAAAAK